MKERMRFEIEDREPQPSDFPWFKVRPDAYFVFEDRDRYHVGRMVQAIEAEPQSYQFGDITFDQIGAQIDGAGNIDMAYVNRMSKEDSRRPIIKITEASGQIRIADGYHRAVKSRKDGEQFVGVWVLNREQTIAHMF